MSTEQLVQKFLSWLAVMVSTGQTAAKTRDFYKHQLKKLVTAAGSVPAAELAAEHLVGLQLTHHLVRAAKRLSRWALENEHLSKDPFRRLRAPRCGQRQRVATPAEIKRLYQKAPKPFRRILFTLLHSCARPQEIRAVRWGDIDLEDRVIRLRKFKASEQRRDGVRVRVIPLDQALTSWLRRKKNLRPRDADPLEYVFTDRDGKPWTSNAFRCAMRRARKAAGLGEDANGERLVCYSMRHTGATRAAQRGIRDSALSEILGHTRTEMTRRYIHRTGADLVKLLDESEQRK